MPMGLDFWQKHGLSLMSVVSFLLLWELTCYMQWVNPVLLSSPSRIALTAITLFPQPAFILDSLFTLKVFFMSLLLALVLGTSLGVLMGFSPRAYQLLYPFVIALNSLPKIVLMPLIVLWVGIGLKASLTLGVLMAGFPIMISTYGGVRHLEHDYLMLARSFGASRGKMLLSIVLPGVIPSIFVGLRVAVNYAMVGVLIAEFFASSQGLGYRIVLFMANFQIDAFFVCLFCVVFITLTTGLVVHRMEEKITRKPCVAEPFHGF